MKQNNNPTHSRRNFIKNTIVAGTGIFIVPRHVLGRGFIPPSDKLNIAGVGIGGQGEGDLSAIAKSPNANISVLCDVDERRAARTVTRFPKATYYKDFRKMLDKEHKNIDAITVSTPDNTHAVVAIAAMQLGKHAYVQKPLTHDIFEARKLTEAAKKYRVVTQMGNQGGSGDGVRRMKEIYDAGLIGDVNKVVAWTNRPIWPQGLATPSGKFEIPKELDWDTWIGPASFIDYHPDYVPFNWRGWYAFGTGALGDMACHILDPAFRILPIDYPTEIECSANGSWTGLATEANYPDSFPSSSIIHFTFPCKENKGDVKLTWMDGGLLPERPAELGADEAMGDWNGGIIMEGTKGKIMADCYGANPRILPLSKMQSLKLPQTILRVPEGHYVQWVNACIAGYGKSTLSSPFEYAGPFTEAVLLGALAIRAYKMKGSNGKGTPGKKKLLWDAKNMHIKNLEEANQFVKREYRKGWEVNTW
ncbi:MAG: Gfo/Idh/MocA family oxidoreductase [Chitinophagaceae bacterium]